MNDITLTDNQDLKIIGGDFAFSESTLQHQQHILQAHKGEYKAFPALGVNLSEALLSENPEKVLSEIKRNFKYDGMQVRSVEFTDRGTLTVDAAYT